MKYIIKFTSQFKKDVKRAKKQNKNIDLLFDIIEKLADGEKIDKKHREHKLSGKFDGIMECHIEPDFLLEYKYFDNELILMCIRVGSHSELFKL